ncbi:hypothetical protein FHR84_003260 [Actinopolyspora biskrensis]|uniref:SCP1.201-like deaminase n=1 Tax=Actinopolyspora biskrensis TaxID=1470178 RepID=A0A852YZ88_9ACTN|nr:DddA-like double-stranded DNA deaminase toxin [Actinopolyspora biskrensis]NYH79911.1 hypothetical protein [Actinopolyspora biskrensis]
MSVGDVVERLRQAREQIPSSRLAEAADTIDQIRYTLAELGSEQDDAVEAYACAERIAELVEQARQVDATVRGKIETYLAQIGGSSGTSEPAAPTVISTGSDSTSSGTSEPTSEFVADDSSRYPIEAQWARPLLEPRVVVGSGRPTIGQAKINGRHIGEMRSGRDGLSERVDERVRAVGIRTRRQLGNHVEMKLASLLIDSQARHGEIVINNAPCGTEPGAFAGCDQHLERFLPSGYSLTVYGTTAQGRKFAQTYHGKASS